KRSSSEITLVPNSTLETPHYEITRVRADQLQEGDNAARSYRIDTEVEIEAPVEPKHSSTTARKPEKPAVGRIARTDAPPHTDDNSQPRQARSAGKSEAATPSLLTRLWQAIIGAPASND